MGRAARKRTACIAFVVAAALITLWWWAIPKDRITPAVYAQIREGMTVEEVSALIGLPPGMYYSDYDKDDDFLSAGPWARMEKEAGVPRSEGTASSEVAWWGDHFVIAVTIDERRKVVGWYLLTIRPLDRPSLIQRILARLNY